MGVSFGGIQTWLIAVYDFPYRDRIKTIVPTLTASDLKEAFIPNRGSLILPNGEIKKSDHGPIASAYLNLFNFTANGPVMEEMYSYLDKLSQGTLSPEELEELWEMFEERSVRQRAKEIKIPVLMIQGWQDGIVQAHQAIEMYRLLKELDPSFPARLILINGGHPSAYTGYCLRDYGLLLLPMFREVDMQRIMKLAGEEIIKWFNCWLKDSKEGVLNPPILYFKDKEITPLSLSEWPPPDVKERKYPLRFKKKVIENSVLNKGSLSNPLVLEEDTVSFTLPPFLEDKELLGEAKLSLNIKTNKFPFSLTAQIYDVSPRGEKEYIINAPCYFGEDSGINPNEITRVEFSFYPVAHIFKKGHRVRLVISNVNLWREELFKIFRRSFDLKTCWTLPSYESSRQRIYFVSKKGFSILTLPLRDPQP